jgi:hypothetical protein
VKKQSKNYDANFVTEISSGESITIKNEYGIDGIHDWSCRHWLSWILTKSSITKTGEHLAKPTVIDRVEAVRNHLT